LNSIAGLMVDAIAIQFMLGAKITHQHCPIHGKWPIFVQILTISSRFRQFYHETRKIIHEVTISTCKYAVLTDISSKLKGKQTANP
jgi:hypothetical protein